MTAEDLFMEFLMLGVDEWWQAPSTGIWHVVGDYGDAPKVYIGPGDRKLWCGYAKRATAEMHPPYARLVNWRRAGDCCRVCARVILSLPRGTIAGENAHVVEGRN